MEQGKDATLTLKMTAESPWVCPAAPDNCMDFYEGGEVAVDEGRSRFDGTFRVTGETGAVRLRLHWCRDGLFAPRTRLEPPIDLRLRLSGGVLRLKLPDGEQGWETAVYEGLGRLSPGPADGYE